MVSKVKFNALKGEKIIFKEISLEAVQAVHGFASDPGVSKFIGWPLMNAIEQTKDFIKGMMVKEIKKTHMYALLEKVSTSEVIGCVMLFNINHESHNAEIGYVIHKDHWHQGYTTEAVALINKYAFEEMSLHKLIARVVDGNVGSSKVLRKNGYVQEGLCKDNYFIDNRYYDEAIYGLIKE